MASAWEPLKNNIFRNLFIAQLVSNVGLWMQSVGAQWFLVDNHAGPTVISLVQTASLAPTLVLSLLAGVLADLLDRKWLLVVTSVYSTLIGVVMALLAYTGHLDPAGLLILTFLLGVGSSLSSPAFQAIQPELVPRDQIPDAASLGSVSVNAARAIGPALAGLIFSFGGAGLVFLLKAISYLAVVIALLMWHRRSRDSTIEPEHVGVAHRRAPLRLVGAHRASHSAAFGTVRGPGLCSPGAVAARGRSFVPPRFHRVRPGPRCAGDRGADRCGAHAVGAHPHVVIAGTGFLGVVVRAGHTGCGGVAVVAVPDAVPARGVAWIATLTTLNAGAQLTLPQWVRARGMSVYLLVFMGSQGIGSFLWGAVGSAIGTRWALIVAAICLVIAAASVVVLPLSPVTGTLSRELSAAWPVPTLIFEPEPDDGPVEVSATYRVAEERHDEFVDAMAAVARSRRRTGARNWRLYRSGDEPDRFVEQFIVSSWSEYRRQHRDRWTSYDHDNVARVLAMTGSGEPDEEHLFTTDVR